MLHDTHLHLDILLQKLGQIQDYPQLDTASLDQSTTSQIKVDLELVSQLLAKHQLAIQATTSPQNLWSTLYWFGSLDKIRFLAGFHPEVVNSSFDLEQALEEQSQIFQRELVLQNLQKLSTTTKTAHKIIGIGEVGLDYFQVKDRALQKTSQLLFESQIEMALSLDLPVVIHVRDAFEDLLAILKNFPKIQNNFLIHCFTGDRQSLKKVLDLGGKVAFGGIITFGKNADYLRDSLAYCDINSLMIETDLPFLSPAPHRGQACLPEYIEHVVAQIAVVKKISQPQVLEASKQNLQALFKIKV